MFNIRNTNADGTWNSYKHQVGRTSNDFDLSWICQILDVLYIEYKLNDNEYENLLSSILCDKPED